MPRFNVYLYPAMVLQLCDIEADEAKQAIAKADFLDADGDCRAAPVYAEEFVRYVVDPVIDGEADYHNSETHLDGAHLAGDQRDRESGFPIYEQPAE